MGNQPQKENLRGVSKESKQNVGLFLVDCNIVLVQHIEIPAFLSSQQRYPGWKKFMIIL